MGIKKMKNEMETDTVGLTRISRGLGFGGFRARV